MNKQRIHPLTESPAYIEALEKLEHYRRKLQASQEKRASAVMQRVAEQPPSAQSVADALLAGEPLPARQTRVHSTDEQEAQLIRALEQATRAQTAEVQRTVQELNREAAALAKAEHTKRVQAVMKAVAALGEANRAEQQLHAELAAMGYHYILPELAFLPDTVNPYAAAGGAAPEWLRKAIEYAAD